MRLAAQMRGGFYPAHPKAIALASSMMQPPMGVPFAMLDPCAGQGAAIGQLSKELGCSPATTYAIELDDDRAACVRASLPKAHVLAPASFFGCRASFGSFSLIWLNPPFDDAYGGQRVETDFLRTATSWLMADGIMAFVCPEGVVDEYSAARQHFATYYENCTIVPFPEEHRPFKEVIVFAHKRARPRANQQGSYSWNTWESVEAPPNFRYHIPSGTGPRVFEKIEPTETELGRMLACSPLRSHLTVPPEAPLPSPPLALGIGHVALLLASGHLNGVVHPEGKPPHVVRGTARKRSFVADVSESDNADGSTTTRTTVSERIELVIRTVDLAGHIRTFAENEAKAE